MTRASSTKRGTVIMPVKPPRDVLQAIAGWPILLAASDEKWTLVIYNRVREALSKRKRK